MNKTQQTPGYYFVDDPQTAGYLSGIIGATLKELPKVSGEILQYRNTSPWSSYEGKVYASPKGSGTLYDARRSQITPVAFLGKGSIIPRAKATKMKAFPDPPPCEPMTWCEDQYADMKKGCLDAPPLCMEGARKWMDACYLWANGVGFFTPGCKK